MVGVNLNMIHSDHQQVFGLLRRDGSLVLYQEPCHTVVEEGDSLIYVRIAD